MSDKNAPSLLGVDLEAECNVITVKQVMDIMCQVVGQYGTDYVYTRVRGGCYNWDVAHDCPSCLIGHIVFRLGAGRDLMVDYAGSPASDFVTRFAKVTSQVLEQGVIQVLSDAQKVQDSGGPGVRY